MLSIIIQTLNEENCLPFLLDSVKKQEFKDYEVIVADAGSGDKTREIAQEFSCKIVKGGFPPKGKNEGARTAKGDLLLFVDADVVLPDNFLADNLKEFEERDLGVASFYQQSKAKRDNFLFAILYNFPARITEKILPQAISVILARKKVHQEVGGFDENIWLGEELDYVRKGKKASRFGVLKSAKVFASSRRYQQDGWLKTWSKYLLCQLHMLFLGPVKTDIFKYRFNHYSPLSVKKEKKEI